MCDIVYDLLEKGRKVNPVYKDLPEPRGSLVMRVLQVQLGLKVQLERLEHLDRQINGVLCDKQDHQDPEVLKAFADQEADQVQTRLLFFNLFIFLFVFYLYKTLYTWCTIV